VTEAAARIRVWDLPTRLFHVALATLVVFSFVTGKLGAGWMTWHMKSGYAILALLVFRLAWGIAGGSTARFTQFIAGPGQVLRYSRELVARRPPFTAGHNPLGGWMVVFMLAILLLQAGTGLFADDEIATQGPLAATVSDALVARLTTFHKYNEWLIVAAVAVHVAAVATYQWIFRFDLIGPMAHGFKRVPDGLDATELAHPSLGLAAGLFAASAALVYWLVVVYPR
jgi:cytochrome b